MKSNFNIGIFAIEINANNYKLTMAITILMSILVDIFAYLHFHNSGNVQYVIYLIILTIEILFMILVLKEKPSIDFIIKNINERAIELIKQHNDKTNDIEVINGVGKKVCLYWPPQNNERDWTINKILENKWWKFKPIFENILRDNKIYEFMKTKGNQYGIDEAKLEKLRYFLQYPSQNKSDEPVIEDIIKALLNMAIDIKT